MSRCVVFTCALMLTFVASWAVADDAKFDASKMVGNWAFVSSERGGEKAPDDRLQGKVVITKDTLTLKTPDGDFVMKYKLDTEKDPVAVELEITESPFGGGAMTKGIIGFDGDHLMICYSEMGEDAPEAFESKEGETSRLIVLKKTAEE